MSNSKNSPGRSHDPEREKLVTDSIETGVDSRLKYQTPQKKCNRYLLVAIVSVGVVAAVAPLAIYYSPTSRQQTSSQTFGTTSEQVVTTAINSFSEDSRWRLEDWITGRSCRNPITATIDSNEYLNMTEKQLIFFTTQGTQRQRLNQFTQNKYVYRPQYTRKEIRQLTDEEWDTYAKAVVASANTYPGGNWNEHEDSRNFSQYQIFTALHNIKNSPFAHFGVAFLPWHREYLLRFERMLRDHFSNVVIPYWDNSLDGNLPDPRQSILFSDRFYGNLEGPVTSGRFSNFQTLPACECFGHYLQRNASAENTLFKTEYFDYFSNLPSFRMLSFGNGTDFTSPTSLHNIHGHVHAWIGGHMSFPNCAPADPIFWGHHSLVDLIFEEFRTKHPDYKEQYYEGIHAGSSLKQGHEPYEPMIPFEPKVNIEGMSDIYTSVFYTYSKRPSLIHCSQDSDCGSKYLWCDTSNNKCTSKVHNACAGLSDKACFCETFQTAKCINDICQCQMSDTVLL